MDEALKFEEDSTGPLQQKDKFLKMRQSSCPPGTIQEWQTNIDDFDPGKGDDFFCERTLDVIGASGTETKPKNMNVVWILKVL